MSMFMLNNIDSYLLYRLRLGLICIEACSHSFRQRLNRMGYKRVFSRSMNSMAYVVELQVR